MTPENKQLFVNHLREAYIEFMNKVLKIPGAPMQKQQGFFRFDEGHMDSKRHFKFRSARATRRFRG
jgi:hypothetical protein